AHALVRGLGCKLGWLEPREIVVQRERKRPCRFFRGRVLWHQPRRASDRCELLSKVKLGRTREPDRQDRGAGAKREIADTARERRRQEEPVRPPLMIRDDEERTTRGKRSVVTDTEDRREEPADDEAGDPGAHGLSLSHPRKRRGSAGLPRECAARHAPRTRAK